MTFPAQPTPSFRNASATAVAYPETRGKLGYAGENNRAFGSFTLGSGSRTRLRRSSAGMTNVEVLSSSSKTVDTTKKFEGYFRLPSMRHYLIVECEARAVVHHARNESGAIATVIVTEGEIELSALGARVSAGRFFAD